jgi:DNA polymerase-3 subunit gamma/tau
MTHQVLALKWRPHSFEELVGQAHVVRALVNGLDSGRMHHAFLFTGTRGVGKTTIARILAKALNCERGVSAAPCGECGACVEIDQGRFVDLIEVDAASRTKVEDTRDLLENVQYTPARGRYKVYLIDEVHMLSGHSFNALLKTLEEPPPHVKFLLATTDPQKLPVTVLSRCLQFNLKRLPAELIAGQMATILQKEGVTEQGQAVTLLARAADGSMRDGLSLLDQAIAYGAGQVNEPDVRVMLGTIDRERVTGLAHAVAAGDGLAVMSEVVRLDEQAPDYAAVLSELATLLHRAAIAQLLPGAVDHRGDDAQAVQELAGRMTPEDAQLFYQIAVTGQRDLPLAPDPRSGFEMTLLRMLAFRPAGVGSGSSAPQRAGTSAPAPVLPMGKASPGRTEAGQGEAGQGQASEVPAVREAVPRESKPAPAPASEQTAPPAAPTSDATGEWETMLSELNVSSMARVMASHCQLVASGGDELTLTLDPAQANLYSEDRVVKLRSAIQERFAKSLQVQIGSGSAQGETPAQARERRDRERQAQAEQAIHQDRNVRALVDRFGANVQPESVRPVDEPGRNDD